MLAYQFFTDLWLLWQEENHRRSEFGIHTSGYVVEWKIIRHPENVSCITKLEFLCTNRLTI